MAINREAFNELMKNNEEVQEEKKFNFSEAIEALQDRLENSIRKPESNEDWIKLLTEMDSYEFVEIAQAVADYHLKNSHYSAQELSDQYQGTTDKQLLMISMTKGF